MQKTNIFPEIALKNLWEWAQGKHTGAIAKECHCSNQWVRQVLKGQSHDPTVIKKAIELRNQKLKELEEVNKDLMALMATA